MAPRPGKLGKGRLSLLRPVGRKLVGRHAYRLPAMRGLHTNPANPAMHTNPVSLPNPAGAARRDCAPVSLAILAEPGPQLEASFASSPWSSYIVHRLGRRHDLVDEVPGWKELGKTEERRQACWRKWLHMPLSSKELETVRRLQILS
jgi:hypothetical protein